MRHRLRYRRRHWGHRHCRQGLAFALTAGSRGMVEAPGSAALTAPTCIALRLSAHHSGAARGAVNLAPITLAANEHYLKNVFERLPTLKNLDLAQPLPHNWRPASEIVRPARTTAGAVVVAAVVQTHLSTLSSTAQGWDLRNAYRGAGVARHEDHARHAPGVPLGAAPHPHACGDHGAVAAVGAHRGARLRGHLAQRLGLSAAHPAGPIVEPSWQRLAVDEARKRFVTDSAYLDDKPGAPLRFLAEANLTQIIRREETNIDREVARSRLNAYIRDLFTGPTLNLPIYRKRLASSFYALRETLEERLSVVAGKASRGVLDPVLLRAGWRMAAARWRLEAAVT